MSPLQTAAISPDGKAKLVANIEHTLMQVQDLLLSKMEPTGYWKGHLSSSALATATAVSAFAALGDSDLYEYIRGGIHWLVDNQNADGGWGDSPDSPSNIPTSMLAQAALNFAVSCRTHVSQECLEKAEAYLNTNAGTTGEDRVTTVKALYGKDRTFAVPILATCALAPDRKDVSINWSDVPTLPFELATFPRICFRALRLGVVSYALPALIAIGQMIHVRRGTRNPLLRAVRNAAIAPTLRLLESIQPASGGFLEAVPLTSFVVMSLGASGHVGHSVVNKGIRFLKRLARADGSWPIDANLSTWLTSLSVTALSLGEHCCLYDSAKIRQWLLARQHPEIHSYTNSRPGGWAWTDLSGGVPDTDDTSAALIALSCLASPKPAALQQGLFWLLEMQNRDGGWPTFCKGWGKLPFDRSAPDLTAHAMQALWTWRTIAPSKKLERSLRNGFAYLRKTQKPNGSWEPLWFGNQSVQGKRNPVYGTTRVIGVYCDTGRASSREAERATKYLLSVQNIEGSWGGDHGAPGTIEETALAVGALCKFKGNETILNACIQGGNWLVKTIDEGGLAHPSPIGLYFANLWYAEMLYPVIWSLHALGELLLLLKPSLLRKQ